MPSYYYQQGWHTSTRLTVSVLVQCPGWLCSQSQDMGAKQVYTKNKKPFPLKPSLHVLKTHLR